MITEVLEPGILFTQEVHLDPATLIELIYEEIKSRSAIEMPSTIIELSHAAADAWQELLAFGGGIGAVDVSKERIYGVPVVITHTGAATDPIRILG